MRHVCFAHDASVLRNSTLFERASQNRIRKASIVLNKSANTVDFFSSSSLTFILASAICLIFRVQVWQKISIFSTSS